MEEELTRWSVLCGVRYVQLFYFFAGRSKQHCSNYRICVARAKQLVDDIVKVHLIFYCLGGCRDPIYMFAV